MCISNSASGRGRREEDRRAEQPGLGLQSRSPYLSAWDNGFSQNPSFITHQGTGRGTCQSGVLLQANHCPSQSPFDRVVIMCHLLLVGVNAGEQREKLAYRLQKGTVDHITQGWPILVLEGHCPACFSAPAHLIQMNGHYPGFHRA